MADAKRIDRFAEQLREELSAVIAGDLDDPRVGIVAVNHVRLSRDLRHAKVYVSSPGATDEGKRLTLEGLNSALGFLRRQLSQDLPHLRRVPELVFEYDTSIENEIRINELLTEIHSDET